MTTLAETLAACPFCGAGDVRTFAGHGDIQYFHCDERKAGCGAVASFSPRKIGSGAIEAWNRRSPEFAELVRRAERYDWIRERIGHIVINRDDPTAQHCITSIQLMHRGTDLVPESFDDAIDQAIAQAGAAGGGERG